MGTSMSMPLAVTQNLTSATSRTMVAGDRACQRRAAGILPLACGGGRGGAQPDGEVGERSGASSGASSSSSSAAAAGSSSRSAMLSGR